MSKKEIKESTHINVSSFKGVQELTKHILESETRKEWGLSEKQFKDLKQTYKKMRQAEKKKGSKRDAIEKSAMREFYSVVGLNPDGTTKKDTNIQMFGVSRSSGNTYAKFPIRNKIPQLTGGSIDTLQRLADNIDLVLNEMDFFAIADKLESKLMSEEYRDWAGAFVSAAQFGDIDYRLLGALRDLRADRDLLIRTAGVLSDQGIELSLSGNINSNIKQALKQAQKLPEWARAFLVKLNNNLK